MIIEKVKQKLTQEEWQQLLPYLKGGKKRYMGNVISLDDITRIWSDYFAMHKDELKYRGVGSRKVSRLIPCQAFMWYCANHTTFSLSEIGNYCGGRDHSTVINSKRAINDMIDTDEEIKAKIEKFVKEVNKFKP